MRNEVTQGNNQIAKRLQWLDIMKGVLIFFVILSHSYPDPVSERFFTPFFLTMFFWVGGYTFSLKDSFKTFIISKLRHLVIPMFILGGMRIVILCVLSGFGELPDRIIGLFLQRDCIYDEMWFLSCIFMAELLLYVLIRVLKGIKKREIKFAVLLFTGLLLLIIGYVIIEFVGIKVFWELELALLMVFYSVCGYVWRKSGEKTEILLKIPVILICFVVYIALWLLIPNDVNIHAERLGNFPLLFLESLLIMPVLVFICVKLEGNIIGKGLSVLGANSLFFFAFGGFGREIFYRITDMVGLGQSVWMAYACAIFTIALMIGPAILFKKWFPVAVGVIRKKKSDNKENN